MIVSYLSIKGGVSKSTTLINQAALLAGVGYSVMIIDADPQGSASDWHGLRESVEGLAPISCVRQYGNQIMALAKKLAETFDFVLIDTAGRNSVEGRAAGIVSNLIVCPCRPSIVDLYTLGTLAANIAEIAVVNPSVRVVSFLSMVSPNPAVNEHVEAAAFFKDYPSLDLLPVMIRDRKAYRDAMTTGRSVSEYAPATKANTESTELFKVLFADYLIVE